MTSVSNPHNFIYCSQIRSLKQLINGNGENEKEEGRRTKIVEEARAHGLSSFAPLPYLADWCGSKGGSDGVFYEPL